MKQLEPMKETRLMEMIQRTAFATIGRAYEILIVTCKSESEIQTKTQALMEFFDRLATLYKRKHNI